jgi:hypothetical protein
MWFVGCIKYNPGFYPERPPSEIKGADQNQIAQSPGAREQYLQESYYKPPEGDEEAFWNSLVDPERDLVEARVHGNPLFDTTMSIHWQHDTAVMRVMATALFRDASGGAASDEAADGDDVAGQAWEELSLDDQLSALPEVFYHTDAFHIIDIDDPELVEFGEEYIHQQLTSHWGELARQPLSEREPWVTAGLSFLDRQFFNNLVRGTDTPGVIKEPIRQRLGLPYQWAGADIL